MITASFLLLSFLFVQNIQAQDTYNSSTYTQAIGGRFGVANGITYKHFLYEGQAIEGILNFQGNRSYSQFKLLGLYQIHQPILFLDAPGLNWYFGGGGGLGSYRYKNRLIDDNSGFALSVDGVIGIDYKIPTAPIALSLDWKPALELTPNTGMRFDGFGLSARFVLN